MELEIFFALKDAGGISGRKYNEVKKMFTDEGISEKFAGQFLDAQIQDMMEQIDEQRAKA